MEAIAYDPERHTLMPDGFYVDDRGEVLGNLDLRGLQPVIQVDSREDAEWVMAAKLKAEVELAAIEARRKNLDAQAAPHKRRLAYLAQFYEPHLVEWARTQLVEGGPRTVALDNGCVKFVRTGLSIKILDQAAAVEFVERWKADEVKKTVGVEGLKAAWVESGVGIGIPRDISSFAQVKTQGESVTVSTGLGKAVKS